ncbi:MAG: serine--tRNA ligase, partial [Arenicellales bacterium]|nr:serine--tRNA ligase [Arenicellales bacterium]
MLDPQLLRNDPEGVANSLAPRGYALDVQKFAELENRRKSLQTRQQEFQAERNRSAKEVGQVKASGGDAAELIAQTAGLGEAIAKVESSLEEVRRSLNHIVGEIPNIPHRSVPAGDSEADNIEQRRWGTPTALAFEPLDHVSLGTGLGMMDFESATRLTGSRFVVLTNSIARMHRALIQFMFDVHTLEHGYEETYVPYLVNAESLFGTGQLPKFADDQFMTTGDPPYYLIPTAEVPVTNLFAGGILNAEELPVKRVCH